MWKQKRRPGRQKNFVVLFLTSHLAILLMVLTVCGFGFHAAFEVVRQDVLDSTEFSLRQCIDYMDESLTDLRTIGLQTSRQGVLRKLGRTTEMDPDYFFTAQSFLSAYYERMLYYNPVWSENTCIYIDGVDRVAYRDAMYRTEVFERVLDQWQTTPGEWMAMHASGRLTPFFATAESGTIYYVIPCTNALGSGPKYGTIYFRIDTDVILDHLSMVDRYSNYCLAVYDGEGKRLLLEDRMGGEMAIPESWNHRYGIWQEGGHLVLSMAGRGDIGLHYILVLPEQQAMQRLTALFGSTAALICLSGLLGTGAALYVSICSGMPVNSIARALNKAGRGKKDSAAAAPQENAEANLTRISHAVAQLLADNEQLLLEQQQSLPALQKTFFHDLLKSDFVSGAEIAYMARRAQIDLTGNIYCAAELHLFPAVDVDMIDGQTVEDARVLQRAIRAHLEEVCQRPVWSYKRNTLEMLYIFEISDQQRLLDVLRDTVRWLSEGYQVESRWGVGSPCHDLTVFWRSAEEAAAALRCDSPDDPVCEYSSHLAADDAYYFPYSVEERLSRALRAGDIQAAEDTLELLQRENFIRRSLNRMHFRRLHGRIEDILSAQLQQTLGVSLQVSRLEKLVLAYEGDCEAYFEALNDTCRAICESTARQKVARCSELVRRIQAYLEQNYADAGLGLAKISVAFDLSESYLSAIFKKEVGTNFAEYLEQLRIRAACQLLAQGCKVASIPGQVGYNSVQSFRRAFKRVMGIAPSEYRSG